MSGGSMAYLCYKMEEYEGCFKDPELDELYKDMEMLLHDREWFDSGDYGSGTYNKRAVEFKEKWLRGKMDSQRMKKYIDEKLKEAYAIIGVKEYCKDCVHYQEDKLKDSDYGECDKHTCCMWHKYDDACTDFERREEDGKL